MCDDDHIWRYSHGLTAISKTSTAEFLGSMVVTRNSTYHLRTNVKLVTTSVVGPVPTPTLSLTPAHASPPINLLQ